MSDVPRRCRVDLATPVERSIRKAIDMVEELPADPILTEAVVLLTNALNKVANFTDRQLERGLLEHLAKHARKLKPTKGDGEV